MSSALKDQEVSESNSDTLTFEMENWIRCFVCLHGFEDHQRFCLRPCFGVASLSRTRFSLLASRWSPS
jgi:hypothetical protein